tara:strand:- start:3564 stop:3761 length:198 start_codon:yes stop_codon:yes gene_type:complete
MKHWLLATAYVSWNDAPIYDHSVRRPKHNAHVLQARRELFGYGLSTYGFMFSINLRNDLECGIPF